MTWHLILRRSIAILLIIAAGCFILSFALRSRSQRTSTVGRRPIHQRYVDPDTSCGPVSLAVVSEYLGVPGTIAGFHTTTKAGSLGVCSMTDLRRAAREHGLAALAVCYDPKRPPSHSLPMILFLDGHHFVTALPGPVGRLVLVDPPAKPSTITWSSLQGRWKGEALIVSRSETENIAAVAQH